MLSEEVRAWIYRVFCAAILVALAFGVALSEEQVIAITALVTAILGNGLAAINTTTKPAGDGGFTRPIDVVAATLGIMLLLVIAIALV